MAVTRAVRWAAVTLVAVTTLMLATGGLASATAFAPVPGATYSGRVEDGTVSVTVSSDGTLITAYAFNAVNGTNGKTGCIIGGGGAVPAWGGEPITDGSFAYSNPPSFDLTGTFDGPQSLSGTLTIGVQASSTDGCSTGVLAFTATTTATPPPTGTQPTSGAPGSGISGTSSPSGTSSTTGEGDQPDASNAIRATTLSVRVSLRRLSSQRLVGTLKASNRSCVARRAVTLWRGRKRAAAGRSTAAGRFTFKTTGPLKNQIVRATVRVLSAGQFTCAAASSTFVKG